MKNFHIQTHQPGRTYPKPHFFILNKGLNSGKPFTAPVRNSFVVSTDTAEDKAALFYLSFMLLESKCYRMYLKGSVIPFIRIQDVKTLLEQNCRYFAEEDFNKKVEVLKKVEALEVMYENKVQGIKKLKLSLLKSCKLAH